MTEEQIYKSAIKKFGMDNQLWKAVEEFGEVITAIARVKQIQNYPDQIDNIFENLREERADCRIMLKQLDLIFNDKSKVDEWESFKLKRLENMLHEQSSEKTEE